ncbi:antichymotrypsin-2-like [Diabrotica undecimpunctata]|uniref:antichymotrypsin-2-like n=1 Tax=Diabrotica undecimpunctata TaxID=50387 RepID=UPI003B64087D
MHIVVVLIVASFFGCNADNFRSVLQGNDKFTANTYKELIKIPGNNNIIVSGLSAEIVLSLVANGARGETRRQLLDGLGLPRNIKGINTAFAEITSRLKTDKKQFKLLSANKMYPAKNFLIKKAFNHIAVTKYDSEVQNLDFTKPTEASNSINDWVEGKTNNKIKNLIDPKSLNNHVMLVLVNALYFSGKWKYTFKNDSTANRLFHISPTESKEIPSMQTVLVSKYAHNDKLKAKFLELEFKDSDVTMTFVLPDEINGLAAVEENLQEYLAPQKMSNVMVRTTLPKFKIETEIDFKPILQSFGIENIFEKEADLTGISNKKLMVSEVRQKAFIDVDENGVEAAAATKAQFITWSNGEIPEEFNADHPFLFYLRSRGLTLFAGKFSKY